MDALARAGIAFHLVKHETAGGFMADAVAQLTRTPGVLVGTIGPGVDQPGDGRRPRLSRPHADDRAHRRLRRGHHGDLHASGVRSGRAARADHQVQRHARGARRGRARRSRDCARHERRARARPSERPGARGRRGHECRPATCRAGRRRLSPRVPSSSRCVGWLASAERPLILAGLGILHHGAHAELAALAPARGRGASSRPTRPRAWWPRTIRS